MSLNKAYSDEVVVVKRQGDQAISSSSQPAIMAIMLEQLSLSPGQRVLEIGAGTGYNAALMAHIVGDKGQVVTVDIDEDLVADARRHLSAAGFNKVKVECSDGWFGYPNASPYDRVIITVAASNIAPAWYEQLKPGGRLVLPLVLIGSLQTSVAFDLTDSYLVSASAVGCGFMRLRGAFAEPEVRLQLGPGLWLKLGAEVQRSVDTEEIYRLLTGPSRDLPTTVEVTRREMQDFLPWLAVREHKFCHFCHLLAEGELADCDLIPCLFGSGKFCATVGLLGERGLSVLMSQPNESLPLEKSNDTVPFHLFLQSYGSDDTLAHALKAQVNAWDAAGRPTTEGLSIRAYPLDTDYTASENEAVIQRRWTRIVLGWHQG